ncbi:MAG: putative sensor domain DACNV-containing protein, partial [Flavobacterium sp.]|uniref:putative sensor domain DACNV-containing protein n=1 Tax=Flavobacterium sp. TaxID=239 RepID=UPI003265D7F2
KVTITLINSNNPDPKPPKRLVKDRWSIIKLEEQIEFNVENIVKLSKAADPWSSSLAVDFDKNGNLFIWALIDQSIHYQNYLHHESESGPEQPGLFQTSITNIGTLLVIIDYELIATLKQNILISKYIDVLKFGRVSEIVKLHAQKLIDDVDFQLKKLSDLEKNSWNNQIINIWTQTISRILIRIQNYHHGGSFIISNSENNNLDIKHKIQYDRIYKALKNKIAFSLENSTISDLIYEDYLEVENEESIPIELYLDESISNNNKKESSDELKGAIRFVASLSCIDGLVVLDDKLTVTGFGAVVRNFNLPEDVFVSKTARFSVRNLESIKPNHFGTRHRAIFSHCWEKSGSIGFVVSQDGDIRAITRIENKLIMWENIRVHHMNKSQKLKRILLNRRK